MADQELNQPTAACKFDVSESSDDEDMQNVIEHHSNNCGSKHQNQNCEVDSDNDDDDDEWNEMEQEIDATRCLFCEIVSNSIELAIQHLHEEHNIDLSSIKAKFHMDQYSYIKMINYIRTHNVEPTAIQNQNASAPLWMDDVYMKPVEVDPWLMFDIDDLKTISTKAIANDAEKPDAQQIEDLQRQLKEKDALIEHLVFQMNQMRLAFHSLIERTDSKAATSDSQNNELQYPSNEATTENINDESSLAAQTHVAQIPIKDDEGYFITYSHFDIHHDMLSDAIRTSSYRDAILKNRNLFEGKTVMDVGCGTSILSMFASQAGAKEIIAIDQSDIIYHAMDIVQRNQIPNIKFIKGRLENSKLPLDDGEKFDIIISEWMGYFLLFEGMLDSVIYARDKYLKADGLMLPNRCNISLVGLGDERRHSEYISFWTNVYGFDMSTMQSEVLKEAIVEVCPNDCLLTEPVIMAEFNVMTVDYKSPNFAYNFELRVKKTGKFTAFVGYFDTFFELPNSVQFTTGPHSKATHWKQVVFYIRTPVAVNEGEIVRGQFMCRRGLKDARALCIQINAFEQSFYYSLN